MITDSLVWAVIFDFLSRVGTLVLVVVFACLGSGFLAGYITKGVQNESMKKEAEASEQRAYDHGRKEAVPEGSFVITYAAYEKAVNEAREQGHMDADVIWKAKAEQ